MNFRTLTDFRVPWMSAKKLTMAVAPVAVLLANMAVALPSHAVDFPDTGDRGAPSSTAGGGTRGGWCEGEMAWDENSLIPMVPKNNVSTFAGEQASLWIVAAPEFSHRRAEIFVRNAQTNEVVYIEEDTLGDLTDAPVIQVDLPAVAATGEPLLKADESYFWEFAVICNSGAREHDYYVRGLMQPVDTSAALVEQLDTATTEEQVELYAGAGIWQETLSTAIQLAESNPELLADLLTSVGLDEVLTHSTEEPSNYEPSNYEPSSYEPYN
ncbi:MAG: DUF928 domain-containing protein [Cyanobacteria bacterium P01_D01_bin.36]